MPETKLRFYAVGEYGDKQHRPHYHLALFGYEPCWYGQTRRDKHQQGRPCCPPCDLLHKKWGMGGIDNADLEPQSAAYIASYVTKKLTNTNDEKAKNFLKGRYPEFSRMSNRPGIGAPIIDKIGDAFFTEHGEHMLTEHGDVPYSLRQSGKSFPLGRYLRQKLRDSIGVPDDIKETSTQAFLEEMRLLYKDAFSDEKLKNKSLKQIQQAKNYQKILNLETKHNLLKKRKTL